MTSCPGLEMGTKVVWPLLKVFWFSKDNLTRHSEGKKKKRQTEGEVVSNIKKWTGMDFAAQLV